MRDRERERERERARERERESVRERERARERERERERERDILGSSGGFVKIKDEPGHMNKSISACCSGCVCVLEILYIYIYIYVGVSLTSQLYKQRSDGILMTHLFTQNYKLHDILYSAKARNICIPFIYLSIHFIYSYFKNETF